MPLLRDNPNPLFGAPEESPGLGIDKKDVLHNEVWIDECKFTGLCINGGSNANVRMSVYADSVQI